MGTGRRRLIAGLVISGFLGAVLPQAAQAAPDAISERPPEERPKEKGNPPPDPPEKRYPKNSPALKVAYGAGGARLAEPKVVHANGPELSWSRAKPKGGVVGYEVHRSTRPDFKPTTSTHLATLGKGATRYTDTTAEPTAASSAEETGRHYTYRVLARTKGGRLIGSDVLRVGVPKPGHTLRVIDAKRADAARIDGKSGAVLEFPTAGLPRKSLVIEAQLSVTLPGAEKSRYELHSLKRKFTAKNSGGLAEPTAGGKPDGETLTLDASALAGQWVKDPRSNKGVLVAPAEQKRTEQEVADAELRVVAAEPTPWDTYHAPGTPTRMTAGNTYPVDVTVTNTTTAEWPAGERELSHRWSYPDGSDATTADNQLKAAIPALAPGASATVKATVKSPKVDGNRRAGFTLTWDIHNKADDSWLSQKPGIGGLTQKTAVEDPTADRLGLEKYHAYTGKNTGAGSTLMANLGSGNAVWSYNAISNPGRGINTFARFTYNAQDTSDSHLGHGWSAQMSGPFRLGGMLDVHPDSNPSEVYVTDGDGTQQSFRKQDDGSWKPAPGYHYRLTQKEGAPASCEVGSAAEVPDAWTMTRPDGTRFVIGCDGHLTSVVDKNGNTQTYEYELRDTGNRRVKFLTQIKDPSGRISLKLDYYRSGDAAYEYLNAQGEKVSGTDLWNPSIYGHLKSVTDISGRKVSFLYTEKGHLGRITDGEGSSQPKVFAFTYDAEQGAKNAKLTKVTDARGNATSLGYSVTAETDYRWSMKDITDRLGHRTDFAYKKLAGGDETKVTDAEQHTSTYETDSADRPVKVTDAKSQATRMTWDSDHNVTVLEEANGAKTAYCYDPKTGFPLWMRSAEENKAGLPAAADCAPGKSPAHSVRYEYKMRADGYAADLVKKTSAEDRSWHFGYDAKGNLKTVTDPKGVASEAADDYTTSYDYDAYGQLTKVTDANGNVSTYQDFAPSGYPATATDALSKVTRTEYDERGQVLSVTDALGKKTTQTYDAFGRPLVSKVPKDQAAGVFITTPAPEYDPNDNVTKSTAPNGAVSTATYDKADQVTEASAPKDTATAADRVSKYTYDKVGNLLTTTEPKGVATPSVPDDYVTTNVYDEIYQLVEVVNAKNDKVRYLYDDVGNTVRVIDPKKNASADPDDYTTKTDYDMNHRVVAVTDAAGRTTKQSYDKDSLVVSTTDAENNTTRQHYDERGKLAVVQVPHDADTVRETKFGYDEVGNRIKVFTPRGVNTEAEADDFVAQTTYDALNRPSRQIQPYDPKDARYNRKVWTETSYDAVGRVSKVSLPPSEGESVRNDTTYDYYDNGQVRKSTDPWNITTTYDYNELGQQTARQLTSAAGSSSRTMRWSFYPDGKLKSLDDDGIPVGSAEVLGADSQAVPTVASAADVRTWKLTIPKSGSYTAYKQSTPDGKWTKVGKEDYKKGEITTLQADAEQVKLVRDNSKAVDTERKRFAYAYDVNGNLTSIDDTSTGRKIDAYTISYTGLNQVSKVVEALAGEEKKSTSYTYDANGQPETLTHPDQFAKYTYDLRELVKTVSVGKSATDASPKVTSYDYTWRGQKQKETKANKNTVEYGYYLDGALKSTTEKKADGTTLVASHTYAYDANGNKAQDVAKKMNADDHTKYLSSTTSYTYDPADRLAKSVRTGDGAGTETYVHDDNANVVSQTVKGRTTTFGYDRNRLLKATADGATATYNYDPFGRQESVTADGKVIERNTFDGFDRVVEHGRLDAASGSMQTTQYSFDPLDRTSSRTANGKKTEYTYLGLSDELLGEEVAGKRTASYQYGAGGERLSQVKYAADGTPNATAYYGYNQHADVETLTGADGEVTATYGYTAYGSDNSADFTGADKPAADGSAPEVYNPYRFNSKRWDGASGTYDMGFRDYSPALNRFTTRDTYNGALADMRLGSDPMTGNRYAFAGGNPVSFMELDGHESCPVAMGTNPNCGWDGQPRKVEPNAANIPDLPCPESDPEWVCKIRNSHYKTMAVFGPIIGAKSATSGWANAKGGKTSSKGRGAAAGESSATLPQSSTPLTSRPSPYGPAPSPRGAARDQDAGPPKAGPAIIEKQAAVPGRTTAETIHVLESRLPSFAGFSRTRKTENRSYVGAVNTRTGESVLASSGWNASCNRSFCAEGNALIALGGYRSEVLFTNAVWVRRVDGIQSVVPRPVCVQCQADYPVPSLNFLPGVQGDPGGLWGVRED